MDKKAPKFDDDNYKKPKLSLIPWEILETRYHVKTCIEYKTAKEIHQVLCGEALNVHAIFRNAFAAIGAKPLAIALGYGVAKYYFESWKEGFGSDPARLLEACLRHCDAFLTDEDFDGDVVEGYPKGNHHQGAILFSLMVAMYEFEGGYNESKATKESC